MNNIFLQILRHNCLILQFSRPKVVDRFLGRHLLPLFLTVIHCRSQPQLTFPTGRVCFNEQPDKVAQSLQTEFFQDDRNGDGGRGDLKDSGAAVWRQKNAGMESR